MKTPYPIIFLFSFFVLTINLQATDFTCANPKPFTPLFSANLYGKLLIAGNTSLCQNSNGQCGDPGASNNNGINMMHVDYDNGRTSNYEATTLNSSAALVDIPTGKKVLWAGLTWQGYMVNWTDAQKEAGHTIKYKHESDSYQTETNAEMNWVYFNASRMYYQGFVDITSYVDQHGGGYYWVGDLVTTLGQPTGGSFGAWALTVVYEDFDESFKNIAVYSGYQAFASNTDIANAITYAQNNGCSTANTGVGNQVTSTLSGFLTPRQGSVKSSFVLFAGEGDISLNGDSGSITDINGVQHALSNAVNPNNNIMNATISKNGVHITSGLPHFSNNSLGADIDTFDMTDKLSNLQTSTDIRLATSGDGYMPGLYGLETELFAPQLCYDYAYKQQDRYFTEDNNGTAPPRLTSTKSASGIIPSIPIDMKIYVRNQVDSDISVNNLRVNVEDINTTQAVYIRNTTQRNLPGQVTPEPVLDSSLSVSDSYIRNIPIGTVSALDHFYIYYQLNPLVSDIDMPIDVIVNYDLTIGTSTIPYSAKLGYGGIPMCSDSNFLYTPKNGIFNIVHNNYYDIDSGGTSAYYNLPTQIVKREGNFKLIALDEINQDELKGQNTIVGVELIDAAAFHDTDASCKEPLSSISERVWITIDNDSTSAMFDQQALQSSLGLNNTLTSSADFYQNARENVAFRLSYIVTADGNDSLVQTELQANGKYNILNFTELVQDIGTCVQPVVYPTGASNNTDTTNNVAVACGNQGGGQGSALSKAHLQSCMECLFGINTRVVCSRDNFSLRPEAFMMHIDDQDQINPVNQTRLTTNYSGSPSATSTPLNLAAGYEYNIEVDAVSHIDNTPSPGYTKSFLELLPDDISQYSWNSAATGCNDITSKPLEIRFLDGKVDANTSVDNVGEYQLGILDKTWTSVDHNPLYMAHHTGVHFSNTEDCIPNSSATQILNSESLNGCNISSSHINPYNSSRYNDYNISYHPYKFALNNIITLGLDNNATSPFIYMADIDSDENMSVHLNTIITAQGFDGNITSNYVRDCYSKPLDITIGKTATTNPSLIYKYITHNRDINTTNIVGQDINQTIPAGELTLNPSITTTAAFFQKDQNGTINLLTNLNYHREVNTTANPEDINFTLISVSDPATLFNADLQNNAIAEGNFTVDQSVVHYYGRTNAPRQRFITPEGTSASPAQALIYYEVYCDIANGCDKSLLQGGADANSTNDPRWFINTNHSSNFGTAGSITPKGLNIVTATDATGNHQDSTDLVYDGSRDYPYKATMLKNASNWLIYNKYDPTATRNEFEVEFDTANSNWAGVRETTTRSDSDSTSKTNRRVMW